MYLFCFVLWLTNNPSSLVGFGISVSKDVCILMLFIQILSGHLPAPQHLVMFIVEGETFPWVQSSMKININLFFFIITSCIYVTWHLLFTFNLWTSSSNALFFYILSYTWQICKLERVVWSARASTLFFNWLCMMIAYGLHQQTLQFADGMLKDATLKRFSRAAIPF